MSFWVRDGSFDVVIVAGPNLAIWPSAGVRAISSFCAEMGLTVGVFGGETLSARGVIPSSGTGGLVLVQDAQGRIHRIQARAIVKVAVPATLPEPFPGWRSQALIPIATAQRLRKEGGIPWGPATAILGSGNRALRFGSSLLESGISEVFCIEEHAQWGAKRFAGWEVERRRFEMLGGKLIEAKVVSVTPKSALLWDLRVSDAQGVRLFEVARVVSAGPYRDSLGVREYPPGSLLFELEQMSLTLPTDDMEGWSLEVERGRWLAGKIVKGLVADLGPRKERLEQVYKRSRIRLKRYGKHREEPFTPAYQGKWVAGSDMKRIRDFVGVPQTEHLKRPVASIECLEEIGCNRCETVCPEEAIEISRSKQKFLIEADCTACGKCLEVCPSRTPVLLQQRDDRSTSPLTLAWAGERPWVPGEFATLVNRRGDTLGSGRVSDVKAVEGAPMSQLVQLEVPTHLLWEARGLKRPKSPVSSDEIYVNALSEMNAAPSERVEVTLDGEKRLVRAGSSVSAALFQMGGARPQDLLFCTDGTCGLCQITVDGSRKTACRTEVHRGMAIRTADPHKTPASCEETSLCPCMNVTREQVIERMQQAKLKSADAVLSVTHLGEGACHGQLCMGAFRRLMEEHGIDMSKWIDWRFPWAEWTLNP